jgi:hypothetical protein
VLRFDKQPSFELGIIAFEVCAGCHAIEDYITAEKNMRGYTAADVADLPDVYPGEFMTLLRSLVSFEPGVYLSAACMPMCRVVAVSVTDAVLVLAAHRPTIADAASQLSSMRLSLYGPDETVVQLRGALQRAHERMVRGNGYFVWS